MLGVAIFYLFNSMDAQTAMLSLTESKKEIVELLLVMLSSVSVFVAVILGFLIIYANNFLMKRRKKEFGLYMLLGMGKWDISKILFGETVLIGLISLVAGLVAGVFGSQLMSIVVAKMFEADMSGFAFVFSEAAVMKTILYFFLMYFLVVCFNAVVISRVKLIDLLNAKKITEKIKNKNTVISLLVFGISILMLVYAYMNVTIKSAELSEKKMYEMIALGCVATYLFFWSLSGFLMQFMKTRKRFYHKNLNLFVVRQLNSQINTNVFSMTIICLLLFVSICVLSSGNAMNVSLKKNLKEMTPRDVCFEKYFIKTQGITDKINKKTIEEDLEDQGFDLSVSCKEDIAQGNVYVTDEITWETVFAGHEKEVEEKYPVLLWDTQEEFISVSDYNRLAASYGEDLVEVGEHEFLLLCTFQGMKNLRDLYLKDSVITIDGVSYRSASTSCQDGYLVMSNSHTNTGVYVLPDSAFSDLENSSLKLKKTILTADYQGETKQEKQEIEDRVAKLKNITVVTKISLYDSSMGLGAIITFLAMYLGIIFLISGAALLALKQLSDSADNKERYDVLRKIGTDDKMIKNALGQQIGSFFLLPMALAVVHSVFGIWFCEKMLNGMLENFSIVTILATAVFLVGIYGVYFLATYVESRRMVEE
jgi:putative ABC transport system permease protein